MKRGLFCITMVLCLINNAYGTELKPRILILGESMENGTASSIGIYAGAKDFIFYGGLSLNYITSSEVIQRNNRKTIYPIYFFAGLKGPWRLSPYIEAGVDLPEAIIDDLINHENEMEDQEDYYYSGGLKYSATDKVSFLLYAKRYNFKFRENIFLPTFKVRPRSYGVGVLIQF